MKAGDAVALTDGRGGYVTQVDGELIIVTIRGEGRTYRREDVSAHFPRIERRDVRKVWAQMCQDARKSPH